MLLLGIDFRRLRVSRYFHGIDAEISDGENLEWLMDAVATLDKQVAHVLRRNPIDSDLPLLIQQKKKDIAFLQQQYFVMMADPSGGQAAPRMRRSASSSTDISISASQATPNFFAD